MAITSTKTKKSKKADLQHIGPGHWVAYSSRNPDNWYHIRLTNLGTSGRKRWTCECQGWINYNHCYHTDQLREIIHHESTKKEATNA